MEAFLGQFGTIHAMSSLYVIFIIHVVPLKGRHRKIMSGDRHHKPLQVCEQQLVTVNILLRSIDLLLDHWQHTRLAV